MPADRLASGLAASVTTERIRGAAPLRSSSRRVARLPLLNMREAAAHTQLVELMAERRLHPGHRPGATGRKLRDPLVDEIFCEEFDKLLRAFEPRCLCGRGPLRIAAQDGIKVLSCVCGFRVKQVKT